MDINAFRERIKTLLMSLPDAKLESGGKAVMIRCRYCGDSKKNKSSRHMYIYLPNGKDPMFHICYRASCNTKGMVTWQKLSEWGVNVSEEDIYNINTYNKHVMNSSNEINFKQSSNSISNTYINDNYEEFYQKKIDYINNRLGTNFTHKDLKDLRISLNISELLYENNIAYENNFIINELSKNYICFLTQNNSYAVCRNAFYNDKVKAPMNHRYYKFNIFNNNPYQSFYIIPTTINLHDRIKIYLSEGTFDILSVKYNVIDDENSIYCAVLGGGFINAIKYFICNKKLIDLEFHLFLDNDMDMKKVFDITHILRPYQYNVYIYNNIHQGEKDFGVPKDRITIRKEHILRGW